MKKFLSVTMILLAVLNMADMGITAYLLTQYPLVVEANIVMHALWSVSPILFVAFKTILSICFFIIPSHINGARIWMYLAVIPATVVYCGVVAWSVSVLVQVL